MKHSVIKTFRDKITGELILRGSTFETDDSERSKDLIERGLAKSNEKASTVKEEEAKEEKPKRTTRKKSGE